MWDDRMIRAAAGGQHGLIGRSELIDAGATDRELGWRIGTGRIDVVHPGVYYLDSTAATWKTDVLGCVMAAGPDALASHRTAAILYELDAIYGRLIEVTVPYSDSPCPEGAILHRTRRINPASVVDAIPTVSPEKALLDIAWIVPLRTLEKALRSAVRKGLTTCEKVDQAVGMFGGRGVSGTRKLRLAVRIVAQDQSGSVAEIDLKHIVELSPVPRAIQQLKVRLPTSENAYPDFAWPDRKRIVEVDGFVTHSSPEALQSDLRRQNLLMELGWEIRRFTATEIREEPDRVRTEVIRFVNRPFRED